MPFDNPAILVNLSKSDEGFAWLKNFQILTFLLLTNFFIPALKHPHFVLLFTIEVSLFSDQVGLE